MRGLTCERAAERRAAGLCPRHDVPAAPGKVLCRGCLAKLNANTARLYGVSEATLAEMRKQLAARSCGQRE